MLKKLNEISINLNRALSLNLRQEDPDSAPVIDELQNLDSIVADLVYFASTITEYLNSKEQAKNVRENAQSELEAFHARLEARL